LSYTPMEEAKYYSIVIYEQVEIVFFLHC